MSDGGQDFLGLVIYFAVFGRNLQLPFPPLHCRFIMGRSVLTDPVYRSGRLQRAVDDLKYYSAHPTYGASQNEVERTFQNAIKSSDRGPFADDEKYLFVELLCGSRFTQRPGI
jgi:hypothetical protein